MTVRPPETAVPSGPGHDPSDPARAGRPRRAIRGWLLTGLVGGGFALAALVIAAYLNAALGVQTALVALLVAVVPLGIVIPTFLWLDRFEAEPTRLLVGAFLWGALAATLIAATVNTSALVVFKSVTNPDAALLAAATVVAPVVEEAAKGVFILLIWRLRRHEFDGVVDGIVYAGIVAAGFAFTENIQYLGTAYSEGGGGAMTATFIGRCIMSPFAHPMFTMLTGVGIGIAATSRAGLLRWAAPLVGYLLAVFVHSMWNLSALAAGSNFGIIFLSVHLPVFLGFLAFIVWARRREGRTIGQFLRPYADSGWLSGAEVAMLASMARRREARAWARHSAGRPGLRSMRDFQDVASELALLRRRMYYSAADADAVRVERELLDQLVRSRRQFLGLAA
jgi:RsiW-degrading membrane proteinase PrsW (M82 family)